MGRDQSQQPRPKDRFRIVQPEDVPTSSYNQLQEMKELFSDSHPGTSQPESLSKDELHRMRKTYLECCLNHVKAEYWGMFSRTTSESRTPDWRTRVCHPHLIDADRVPDSDQMYDFDGAVANYDVAIKSAVDVRRGGTPVDLANLKGHLCIWRDNLFYTHVLKLSCGCRSNRFQGRGGCNIHRDAKVWLLMRKLRPMLPDYPDPEASKRKDYQSTLYSMGLVDSFMKTITVLELMQRSLQSQLSNSTVIPEGTPNLAVLDALCHPALYGCNAGGRSGFKAEFGGARADAMPFNSRADVALRPEQIKVIHALQHILELIEGPPGTGKSTMIRAIIRQSLPHEVFGTSLNTTLCQAKKQHHPIDQYLATPQERIRSGYPDKELPGHDNSWISTAGRRVAWEDDDADDSDERHLVALDCEMVETSMELSALARVSLVDADGAVMYDTLVKPPGEVTDYRTPFSGISQHSLEGIEVTLADVQAKLLELLSEQSILVGHSLENDLMSLKLVHDRVMDTALLFPHPIGLPHRRSLDWLCRRFLGNSIDRSRGHDSVADARVAMKLARLKCSKGPDFGLPARGRSVTLLLAVQNKAIDVLVRGIEPFVDNDVGNSHVGMLVMGSETNPKMGDIAAKYTLDGLLRQNTNYNQCVAEYENLHKLAARGRACPSAAQAKEEELKDLMSLLTEQILCEVGIVFSTMAELFNLFKTSLHGPLCPRITSLIFDEAGTVPEYGMALAASLPAVKRIACIGDTQQLPPFSHLPPRSRPPSFMERVQHDLNACEPTMVKTLTRQFRMSRFICNFVSDSFYKGQLIMDDIEGARRMPEFVPGGGAWLSGIYWLDYSARPPSHVLHDVYYKDERGVQIEIKPVRSGSVLGPCGQGQYEETRFSSLANATEVFHIMNGLELFCKHGFFEDSRQSKTVAVICFYRLQCEVLEASLAHSEFAGHLSHAKDAGRLRVRTVDSFQGDEADIIILSCVRSNTAGHVGFLASQDGQRRSCVALSRAKEALVVVADSKTLGQSSRHSLALGRLWAERDNARYNLRKLRSFDGLMQPSVAAAQRQAEDIINDLFC